VALLGKMRPYAPGGGRATVTRQEVGNYVLQITIVFLAYVVAGKLGQATADIRSSNLGPVWPAFGVALAAVLLCGYRIWVGIVAAAFLVAYSSPVPHLAAAGQAAGATLAALTGTFLLRRIVKFDPSLSRLRDAIGLIVFGAFGSAVVSASIGVFVLYAAHVQAYSGFGSAWLIYWLGDATGVLLVTPLVLTFPALLGIRPRARFAEFAVLLLLLTAACFIIFGDLPLLPVRLHVLAFAVLPFVMWAAIRFGVVGATLSTLFVATVATVATALGSGPFAQRDAFINAVLLDVFFAVLSVSGMTLAAVIAEREQVEMEREQLVREQAATEARRDSEDKLRLILDSTAEGIYGLDLEGRCTFCNQACLRFLGYERADDLLGKNMHYLIHHTRADGTPLPLEECRIFQAFRTGEKVHVDSEVLWKANGARFPSEYWSYPQRRGGELVGAVVAFVDITQRKAAEEALSSVSRKLIEAQEQERFRIARELHDDTSQRLAMLAVAIEQLKDELTPEAGALFDRVSELQEQTSEIATDIQSLSHELHSSKLEYLGLVAAARGFCREFGEQQKVEIAFETHDLPNPLPREISLCLFRVLQEALHNSAKHSGVRHFEVGLWGTSGEIHLTVADSGLGFDCETAKQTGGLGLISMEERVKALSGMLSIESKPNRGTTVHARVPLGLASDSLRAAG
jgi:PAS domain S-box-containing protein